MLKRWCTIVLLFLSTATHGQNDLIFDHYGLEAGFENRDAKNIITSKNGMVWISTDNGLVRFDGKRFKTFKNIEGDSNSLQSNNINSLVMDNRGFIWVGGFNTLHIFNPYTETFKNIKFPYASKDYLPKKPFPFSFKYDNNKDILWIGTSLGLYYCKGGTTDIKSIQTITKDKEVAENKIFSIAYGDRETLWLTYDYTIIKLNTINGATEKYEIPNIINKLKNDPQFSYIACSYLDKNKILWLGSTKNGLIKFNTITKSFNQFYFNTINSVENKINSIAHFSTLDQDDVLYLATNNYGLAKFNTKENQFKFYKSAFINGIYGIKNNAYGLYIDLSNALWIGSDNGLYKLDGNKQIFNTISLENLSKTTPNSIVTRIACEQNAEKKDKKIWFFIPDVGCYIYNMETKKNMPLPQKIIKYINPSKDFYSFFIDRKNRLWINNNLYGLICYSINKDEIIIPEKKYFYTEDNWVNTFYEDKNENLWLGTNNGLYVVENKQIEIRQINEVKNFLHQKELSKNIISITEDNNGNIWFIADFSTKPNASIATYNIKTKTCNTIYEEKTNSPDPTKINNLEDISIKNNKAYILDFGTGLLSFNINDKNIKFINITKKNNQIPNYIRSFVEDNNQNIWCSTIFGVSHFLRTSENAINYNYTSYLLSDNKYPHLFFSKQSGVLYIAQSQSIKFINTNSTNDFTHNNNLVFTEFKLFDKEYKYQNKPIQSGDKLVFQHNENMLSIEFALLSYFNSNENTYSWKLEGLENNWNVSKNNIASYANLQPGSYTLLVKAANSNGNWSTKTLKLFIKIKPPFYKTWWFILLCIATIASSIYYFVQLRFKSLKEKYTLQNKIASDLHDEVGSTLTSINILSNISQQAMDTQPLQAKEMLQKISSQSKTIQQNISDIVWSIRPDNEKGENLIIRMREYASQTLEPLNIKYELKANDFILHKALSMTTLRELLLIYKEAISNIVKHSNASVVTISISKLNKLYCLAIQDNGVWKGNNSGTGTKTMKERAKAIGGTLTLEQNHIGTLVNVTFTVT